MFKRLRIALLLFVLATVAVETWRNQARVADWGKTLHVAIYPIAADGSPVTLAFVTSLDVEDVEPLQQYLAAQAARYRSATLQPVSIRLAPPVLAQPPVPPPRPNVLSAIWWSLSMRLWASRHDQIDGPQPDVRLFALFHDPARTPRLRHSLALREGFIGLANVYADRGSQGSNRVVIAHELLHTLGATDKYDPASNQPMFPGGYAAPEQSPLLPQTRAEIMAGRIPLSETEAAMPESLHETLIGPVTAKEIGLLNR
jgi:hypothetical protein